MLPGPRSPRDREKQRKPGARVSKCMELESCAIFLGEPENVNIVSKDIQKIISGDVETGSKRTRDCSIILDFGVLFSEGNPSRSGVKINPAPCQ